MSDYDIFNGDADGICALQQLRLAEPREAELITGLKRDIALVAQVEAGAGDRLTVLDISLDKNRDALIEQLGRGAEVAYFDHHFAGEVPQHEQLDVHIDPSPDTCTSLIVNAHLSGAHAAWAVAGAYGDNFFEQAEQAAAPLGLDGEQLEALKELGTCLNYNGYGITLDDLFFHPKALFLKVHPYADPFDFIANESAYHTLRDGYLADLKAAEETRAAIEEETHALFILPDEAWARRVSGVYGNDLARKHPNRAHALLTQLADGGYRVSVRAPLATKEGADDLCRQFPTGGGRKAAAGINLLDEKDYAAFCEAFAKQFS